MLTPDVNATDKIYLCAATHQISVQNYFIQDKNELIQNFLITIKIQQELRLPETWGLIPTKISSLIQRENIWLDWQGEEKKKENQQIAEMDPHQIVSKMDCFVRL